MNKTAPHMIPIILITLAALSGLQAGCGTNPHSPDILFQYSPMHLEVAHQLTGHFTSENQAVADPDHYFNIHLNTARIWPSRNSETIWLYVEQAAASSLDRPYRQRVYGVSWNAGGVVSRIYTLPGDPLDYAGAYTDPSRFHALTPDLLEERTGCAVYLTRTQFDDDTWGYVGQTIGNGCGSSLGDAAYATSRVELNEDRLTSWDQGWTADGQQAWGATEGPYVFERVR